LKRRQARPQVLSKVLEAQKRTARKGTIVWRFADDYLGAVHTFRIPNSYYVPQAEYRPLSPQHWAQAYSSKREKMGCDTNNGVKSVLYWPDAFHQRRTLTIPHGRLDNVSTFRLADGYDKFQVCTEIGESLDSDDDPLALPLEVVSDKDDDYDDGDNSGQTSTGADLRGRIIGPSTDQSPATEDDVGYVHLQKTQEVVETIEGKEAFERFAATHGVKVENYHADNGIFRANKWMEHCQKQSQGMTFAAVGAHHTNGLAERRIKEVQSMTRASLIFANHRWKDAITANLWPYAMRMANESINASPLMKDKARRSPDQIFSNTMVSPNPKHFKPFGCPVYVLDPALQAGQTYHKWKKRARVGIYIGRSPRHPRNVALVLNLTTGLVSPQFHVRYDSSFSTVEENNLPSQWQHRAGFVAHGEKIDDAASTSTNTGFAKRAPPVGREIEQPIQGNHKRARLGVTPSPERNHEKALVVGN
jgi:hypothetical protein